MAITILLDKCLTATDSDEYDFPERMYLLELHGKWKKLPKHFLFSIYKKMGQLEKIGSVKPQKIWVFLLVLFFFASLFLISRTKQRKHI